MLRGIVFGAVVAASVMTATVHAQTTVASAIISTCTGCANGTVDNITLSGILFRPDVTAGTIWKTVDSNGGSMTYKAVIVTKLPVNGGPSRVWSTGGGPGGPGRPPLATPEATSGTSWLVMQWYANDSSEEPLESLMRQFYNDAPVGWVKRFVPDSGPGAASIGLKPMADATELREFSNTPLGAVAKSMAVGPFATPVPVATVTYPDGTVSAWNAVLAGSAQNNVIAFANNSGYGRGSVVLQSVLAQVEQIANMGGKYDWFGQAPQVVLRVVFMDGSFMDLTASPSAGLNSYEINPTLGTAQDSQHNNIPYTPVQIGGPNGAPQIYNFQGSQANYQHFVSMLSFYGISAPVGPTIACIEYPQQSGATEIICNQVN
jgi:hypothetical protein